MLILAFDTTSEWGGAAIFNGEQRLAQARHEGPSNYSISLFEVVNGLADQAGVELREIDLFAAASGPGSFTGIRVGLAAAQGWSHAFEKPWRGVSVFEAMVEESATETNWTIALLDARRGEFYAGLFRRSAPSGAGLQNQFEAQGDGRILKPDHLRSILASHVPEGELVTCIAREEDAAAGALEPFAPSSCRWRKVSGFLVPAIARLALRAAQHRRAPSVTDLSAYYVRRTDAELNLKS